MKRLPVFAPYPLAREPRYSRWFAGAVGLLALLGVESVLPPSQVAPHLAAFTMGACCSPGYWHS